MPWPPSSRSSRPSEDASAFELFLETGLGKAIAEAGAVPVGAPDVQQAFNLYTP